MKKSLLMMWKWRGWMTAMALFPLLSSCLQNNAEEVTPVSYVSLYHISPDASGLDISVNDVKLNQSAFSYENYSGYLNFSTGVNNFKLYANGSTTKLSESNFTFAANRIYSVFILNRLAKLEMLALKDSSAAVTPGHARVRLIHLSPDAPAIDVFSTGSNSTVLFSDRTFKTNTEFVEIDAKTYTLNIRSSDNDTVLGSEQTLSFVDGGYYTLLVQGFASPPTGNTNTLKLRLMSN